MTELKLSTFIQVDVGKQNSSYERVKSAPPKLIKNDKWSRSRRKLLSCVVDSIWSENAFIKDRNQTPDHFSIHSPRDSSVKSQAKSFRRGDIEEEEDMKKFYESSRCSSVQDEFPSESSSAVGSDLNSVDSVAYSGQSSNTPMNNWRKVHTMMKVASGLSSSGSRSMSRRGSAESTRSSGPIHIIGSNSTSRSKTRSRRQKKLVYSRQVTWYDSYDMCHIMILRLG